MKKPFNNHIYHPIILIGFKHVGKSVVGKQLAERINVRFIDLDTEIEFFYSEFAKSKKSCREIMEHHGELYFRGLERKVLLSTLINPPGIIALGGGVLDSVENQVTLEKYKLIHITAPKKVVFERILKQGAPAFCQDENVLDALNRRWESRMKIYNRMADLSINNDRLIDEVTDEIIQELKSSVI